MLISISQSQMRRLQTASFVQTTAQNTETSLIIISVTEKQQILTFKKLNQQFILLFYLKNDLNG